MPAAPVPVSSAMREYEFDEVENAAVADLSSKMRFVGVASIALGVVIILLGLLACFQFRSTTVAIGVGNLVEGVVLIAIGVWTKSSAASFQRIVDTEGDDISNLLMAISDLRRVYGLQRVMFIVGLALIAVALLLAFLFAIL